MHRRSAIPLVLAVVAVLPPIAQDPEYHAFARSTATALVALGSGYYHWLPMTVVFLSLLASTIANA
jgi:hypothetical protein